MLEVHTVSMSLIFRIVRELTGNQWRWRSTVVVVIVILWVVFSLERYIALRIVVVMVKGVFPQIRT